MNWTWDRPQRFGNYLLDRDDEPVPCVFDTPGGVYVDDDDWLAFEDYDGPYFGPIPDAPQAQHEEQ